jgi:tetratricopeptide (TPR) repeat protein
MGMGGFTGVKPGDIDSSKFRSKDDKWYHRLWFKPETRDERVKEYVPEVIEESIAEQRALMAQQTPRDILVEHGHRVLALIENKAPTPSISPSLNHILKCFGNEDLISQRALSYLIYPTTSSAAALLKSGASSHTIPDLIASWTDNFRTMVQSIEQDGTYVNHLMEKKGSLEAPKKEGATGESATAEETATATAAPEEGKTEDTKQQVESPDVTMFVKVVSGMSLANMHCNDLKNAVACCDAALKHVVDTNRKGGVLALKAGLLNKEKRYTEAAECALLAVEASGNIQGYLQGYTALRLLNRKEEAMELLESGVEAHPQNTQLKELADKVKSETAVAVVEGQPTGLPPTEADATANKQLA